MTGGKGVLPSLAGVPAIFFRLVAAGPVLDLLRVPAAAQPRRFQPPALTRQANGRADASHEGGAPTG